MRPILCTAGVPLAAAMLTLLFPPLPPLYAGPALNDDERPDVHPYIDDEDRRPLAGLEFAEDPQKPGSIVMTISAVGPEVEPIVGYRGVFGANRYTAEELELLLEGKHAVRIESVDTRGNRKIGTLREGEFGSLPQRRLDETGRVDFLARTGREYPLSIRMHSGLATSEPVTLAVFVNGIPRLRARCRIINGQVRVLELQSLGGDHTFAASELRSESRARTILTTLLQSERPSETISDWEERDIEGRWVAIQKDIRARPERLSAWVMDLAERKEFELLEMLAVCEPDCFKSHGAGDALQIHKAPQWIRVAVWNLGQSAHFGHGVTQAGTLLTKRDPELVKDWLIRNELMPEQQEPDSGNSFRELNQSQTSVEAIASALRADSIGRKNSSSMLPPLTESDLFSLLDSADTAVSFGDRKKAEPGVVYVHQVLRAANAVVVSGRYESPRMTKLAALISHPEEEIRQGICLAYTHIIPSLRSYAGLPDFRASAENDDESDAVREAAVLADSYRIMADPTVLLTLSRIARDHNHPGWSAAVSRLGDLLPAAASKLLQPPEPAQLSAEQMKILVAAQSTIATRPTGVDHYRRLVAAAAAARLLKLPAQEWKQAARNAARSIRKDPTRYSTFTVEPTVFDSELFSAEYLKVHQSALEARAAN